MFFVGLYYLEFRSYSLYLSWFGRDCSRWFS